MKMKQFVLAVIAAAGLSTMANAAEAGKGVQAQVGAYMNVGTTKGLGLAFKTNDNVDFIGTFAMRDEKDVSSEWAVTGNVRWTLSRYGSASFFTQPFIGVAGGSTSGAPGSSRVVFGADLGAAYAVSGNLSVAAALTSSYAPKKDTQASIFQLFAQPKFSVIYYF